MCEASIVTRISIARHWDIIGARVRYYLSMVWAWWAHTKVVVSSVVPMLLVIVYGVAGSSAIRSRRAVLNLRQRYAKETTTDAMSIYRENLGIFTLDRTEILKLKMAP